MASPAPDGRPRRGRPGPRRNPVPLRLSPDERTPVDALAATLPPVAGRPNTSGALRRLIAAGAAHLARPHLPISDAGAAELDRLATEHGLTRDEIGRRALTYAVARAHHWLP